MRRPLSGVRGCSCHEVKQAVKNSYRRDTGVTRVQFLRVYTCLDPLKLVHCAFGRQRNAGISLYPVLLLKLLACRPAFLDRRDGYLQSYGSATSRSSALGRGSDGVSPALLSQFRQ